MRYLTLDFWLRLLICCLFAIATNTSFAAAPLSLEEMANVRGGCNGHCVKRGSSCWEGCIPGECDLKRFCADFTNYNYGCDNGDPTEWCNSWTITGGCGDEREDGDCSGLVGECMYGKTIGHCNRSFAQGITCR
jgi:hypothetical protein